MKIMDYLDINNYTYDDYDDDNYYNNSDISYIVSSLASNINNNTNYCFKNYASANNNETKLKIYSYAYDIIIDNGLC